MRIRDAPGTEYKLRGVTRGVISSRASSSSAAAAKDVEGDLSGKRRDPNRDGVTPGLTMMMVMIQSSESRKVDTVEIRGKQRAFEARRFPTAATPAG